MLYLKQSTASQAVLLGPYVDDTDGNTAETGLTVNNTDIRVSKNGANIVAKNSGGGTHDELGYYTATFDATDTDTVGQLQVMSHVSGALPVYHEFWVLEENVYDALFAASAAAGTDLASILADTNELQSDNVPGLIATAQADLDIITGASGVNLLTATQASIDAIEADTNELQGDNVPGLIATAQADLDIITGASGVNLLTATQASIDAIEADTNELQTDDIPTTLAALNDISVADILTTAMTEAYAADGVAPTLAQALFLIQQSIGDFAISGTTITVKKLDGSTTAATYTLDDGTDPTSRTRAS